MEKKVNINLAYTLGDIAADLYLNNKLKKEFAKWPEDPNGTIVKLEWLQEDLKDIIAYSKKLLVARYVNVKTIPVPTVEVPSIEESPKNTYRLNLRAYKNKSFEWIPLDVTHALKGKKVEFDFSNNCGMFTVPDGTVTHGKDGNSRNHNQMFYFCGTDFPAEASENNGEMASVFTAPGCVASSVVITW